MLIACSILPYKHMHLQMAHRLVSMQNSISKAILIRLAVMARSLCDLNKIKALYRLWLPHDFKVREISYSLMYCLELGCLWDVHSHNSSVFISRGLRHSINNVKVYLITEMSCKSVTILQMNTKPAVYRVQWYFPPLDLFSFYCLFPSTQLFPTSCEIAYY